MLTAISLRLRQGDHQDGAVAQITQIVRRTGRQQLCGFYFPISIEALNGKFCLRF